MEKWCGYVCVSVFVFFSLVRQPRFLHAFTCSLKTNAKLPSSTFEASVCACIGSGNCLGNCCLRKKSTKTWLNCGPHCSTWLFSENLEAVKNPIGFTKVEALQKSMENVILWHNFNVKGWFSSYKSTEHPSPQNLQGLHCTKGWTANAPQVFQSNFWIYQASKNPLHRFFPTKIMSLCISSVILIVVVYGYSGHMKNL